MHVCDKPLQALTPLFAGLLDAPEILCLQEVGGEARLKVGQTSTRDLFIGDVEYVVYVHNTAKAHHAVAVAIQTRLAPAKPCFTAFAVGLGVELFLGPARFFLASLHFPYEQRSDATDVWMDAIEGLTLSLSSFPSQHSVFLGCDLNQTLHAEVDHFAPVVQLRLLLARFLLQTSDYAGDTWHARGLGAAIDYVLFRHQGTVGTTVSRPDVRLALPSDHDMVQVRLAVRVKAATRQRKSTGCGRWALSGEDWAKVLEGMPLDHNEEDLARAFRQGSFRHKFLKYRDSPEIKELIRRRKIAGDADLRAALVLEITQLRATEQEAFRKGLLERARRGDFAAISLLRRILFLTFLRYTS